MILSLHPAVVLQGKTVNMLLGVETNNSSVTLLRDHGAQVRDVCYILMDRVVWSVDYRVDV